MERLPGPQGRNLRNRRNRGLSCARAASRGVPAYLACVAFLGLPPASGGQEPGPRLAVDVQPIGAAISFLVPSGGRHFGLQLGGGGSFLELMLVGGRHFAEDGGIAYQTRDVSGGKLLFELVQLSLFLQTHPSERWDVDVGLRASAFLHFDDSDDDPGGGVFLGAYAQPMWGTRRFKVGPRVMLGAFSESSGLSDAELGVHLAALVGRVVFGR